MKKTIGKIKYVLAAAAMCLCAAGGLLWGTEFSVPRIAYAADPVMHEGWQHPDDATVLTGELTELTDAYYYLEEDITLENAVTITQTVEICLNGYQLALSEYSSISIDEGGALTLWDCEQGECQQHTADNGTAHKGEITGATDTPIMMFAGTFTMNGGSIAGNTSEYYAGGVLVYDNAVFTMNGGKISNNTVTSDYGSGGGGVFVSGGTFIMNGGEISDNTVSVVPQPDGGSAYVGGGGIYAEHGTVEIKGGVISGNSAANGYGGGIFLNATKLEYKPDQSGSEPAAVTFTLEGDALIANNTAKSGGGIAMFGGVTANMTGGTVGGKAYSD